MEENDIITENIDFEEIFSDLEMRVRTWFRLEMITMIKYNRYMRFWSNYFKKVDLIKINKSTFLK